MSTAPLPLPVAAPRARLLREARGVPAEEILPLRTDPGIVEKNVSAGVAAVLAYDAHIAEHLPSVDLGELRSLPELARVVAEIAREVAGDEEGELGALFAEACALRRTLRAAAVALVEAGVLGPRDLGKLGPERGAVDVGADCGALASLFQRRAEEVEGKAAVDEEQIARAQELASALRAAWKPKGAAKKPGPDGTSLVEARDRLWTLLVLRHERLWAVGAYVFGHTVDARVPALHALPEGRQERAKPRARARAAAEPEAEA